MLLAVLLVVLLGLVLARFPVRLSGFLLLVLLVLVPVLVLLVLLVVHPLPSPGPVMRFG